MATSKGRRTRKIERWNDIIKALKIDVSKPITNVTAAQIKQITGEEPRLMAKMDRIECLPEIFLKNNLFLLPITRREYSLVKGTGYHTPEPISKTAKIYTTSKPFPTSAIGIESESVFLDYANSCGLLEKVCRTKSLVPSVRGRTTTGTFDFLVRNAGSILVKGAQIEIDAAYESPHEVVIFEGKIGLPSTFSIRQLYYAYRTFKVKKRVRNFFFCFIPQTKNYLFWEYEFNPPNDFNSISILKSERYEIRVTDALPIGEYQNLYPDESRVDIPQADDVNKILQFPLMVFDGYDTSDKMVDAFGFVKRQSSYYRQASEILGLVTSSRFRYNLTSRGEKVIKLPAEQKSNYICKLLLQFPIMHEIFMLLTIDHKVITKGDIVELLKAKSHLSGTTLPRRAQTIISWFRWIRNNVGLVDVDVNGNIRVASQLKIQ